MTSIHSDILYTKNNTRQKAPNKWGMRGLYKAYREGKINKFEKTLEREFVKKKEKDIGYKDKLNTIDISVLYYTSHFFLLPRTFFERVMHKLLDKSS